MFQIYCWVNKFSNKKYIGKTSNIFVRDYEHNYKVKTGDSRYFYNAVRKYGWENFTKFILWTGDEKEESWKEREMYFIQLFNSHGDGGYNLTDGGEGTSGYSFTQEQRKKCSDIQFEVQNRPEIKLQRSSEQKIIWKRIDVREKHSFNLKKSYKIPGKIEKHCGENNGKSKTTWDNVFSIREKYKTKKYSILNLSKEIGLSWNNTQLILQNKAWFDKKYTPPKLKGLKRIFI